MSELGDPLQEELEGIAEILMPETGRTMTEAWEEALSIYRVQFNSEVLPPLDEG